MNMMASVKLAEVDCANFDLTQQTCLFATAEDCNHTEDKIHQSLASIMTQYTHKVGVRVFGGRAKDAAFKELKQLHTKVTMVPKQASELTKQQRHVALEG